MQWLCSSSSFPERIDSSFWYWGLEKIEASEWEPPWYPFQERWQHSLGLYLQRLPLIYKPKAYLLLNHHWCAAQVQWVQVFTKLNITMHLNWIMSPGKSVSLLYPLTAFNIYWLPMGVNYFIWHCQRHHGDCSTWYSWWWSLSGWCLNFLL